MFWDEARDLHIVFSHDEMSNKLILASAKKAPVSLLIALASLLYFLQI